MQTSNDRTYLAVPYAEKDQAKAAGAKWDREAKAWFAPAGTDLQPLSAWLTPRDELHVAPQIDPRAEFAEALRTAGLEINGLPEMNGQLQRVRVAGDTGQQRSGAYVGHLDGHPAGYIQNFKTGLQQNWKSGAPMQPLGAQDRVRLTAEAAQKAHDRAIERETAAQAAALTAEAAWSAAPAAAADHPYLVAKDVGPGELRMGGQGQTIATTDKFGQPKDASLEGKLIVPMRDIDGKLWSIQTIDGDGTKSFHKNGRVEGMHAIVGGELTPDSPIIIAEGFATAQTVTLGKLKAAGDTTRIEDADAPEAPVRGRQGAAKGQRKGSDAAAASAPSTARKIYFSVPYEKRAEARAAGLRWDSDARKWYAPTAEIAARIKAARQRDGSASLPPADSPQKPAGATEGAAQQAAAGGARVYFKVPFEQKEKAKELGMRFDGERRQWFAPDPKVAQAAAAVFPSPPA